MNMNAKETNRETREERNTMLTPREIVMIATAKAEGVMCALYGLVRDMNIGGLVDKDENGKLGDVVADTLAGLTYVREAWSFESDDDKDAEGGRKPS